MLRLVLHGRHKQQQQYTNGFNCHHDKVAFWLGNTMVPNDDRSSAECIYPRLRQIGTRSAYCYGTTPQRCRSNSVARTPQYFSIVAQVSSCPKPYKRRCYSRLSLNAPDAPRASGVFVFSSGACACFGHFAGGSIDQLPRGI
jgi:hypothetical protein